MLDWNLFHWFNNTNQYAPFSLAAAGGLFFGQICIIDELPEGLNSD